MQKIPFKKINLGESYNRVKPLFENGMIGLGNTVYEFEEKLAEYVGAKHVVAVDSCTSALFLSLKWEQGKQGLTRVSIPSMTVPLALNAAFEAGLEVVLDDRHEWIGSKYMFLGAGVIDSAHELRRNSYRKMREESLFGPLLKMCFSFYPTKTIGSADGGAIATDDPEFARWAKIVSTYGRNQGMKYGNSWDFDVEMIGYKRHYTNLQAAICLEQLERLDETNARRAEIMHKYDKAFGKKHDSDYLYRLNVKNRDEFVKHMSNIGIECGVHFKPLHLMTPFRDLEIVDTNTDTPSRFARERIRKEYNETVSLPFYDTMTDAEVDYIIGAVLESEAVL